MSTGWKLVSFLLSKPTPNSICGTLQLPKLPIADEEAVDVGAAVIEMVVAASMDVDAASVAAAVTVTVIWNKRCESLRSKIV